MQGVFYLINLGSIKKQNRYDEKDLDTECGALQMGK